MGIWYIKELNELDEITKRNKKLKWIQKIIYSYKRKFCKITTWEIENKMICVLPIENKKPKNKKKEKFKKLAKQINNILQDKPNQNVVLSEYLSENIEFKNELYSYNINILDGRWLFLYLLPELLDFICIKKNELNEEQEIAIMVNDNKETHLKIITEIAQKVKMVNVITNNIEKFKKLEEYLYDNLGIMIRITNNTKKSLSKSGIIINLDFPEEILNKYTISKKAILVNTEAETMVKSKRFSGINVHYYKVVFPQKHKEIFQQNNIYESFDKNILYESLLYRRNSYENIRKEIQENKSKIVDLVGNKGIIAEEEFKRLKTNL